MSMTQSCAHEVPASTTGNSVYEVLTVKDVAGILKISLPLAYQLFKCKDFPALQLGQRMQKRVSRAAFERWLMRQQ